MLMRDTVEERPSSQFEMRHGVASHAPLHTTVKAMHSEYGPPGFFSSKRWISQSPVRLWETVAQRVPVSKLHHLFRRESI